MLTELTKTLHEIEKKFDSSQLMYRDISLWAVFRIYLADVLNEKYIGVTERGEPSRTALFRLIRSFFYFNPFKIFKKYDIWLFDAAEQRKIFENKALLRNSGAIPEHFEKSLVIESPFPKFHTNKKQIPDKNVISAALFYFITFIFECFFRFISLKFKGEAVLKQINKAYNINFTYKNTFYRFWGQYYTMLLLLKITKNPKLVTMICPSTKMGYVLAFKQKKIKVIEIQHGVINKNHQTYNSLIKNPQYSPDEIIVYGSAEKTVFERENRAFINPNCVYPMGNYFLEKIKSSSTPDLFAKQRKEYDVIMAVAGQEDLEKRIITFLNRAAKINRKIFYAYIPRIEKDCTSFFTSTNTGTFIGNIYECIKMCDVHTTVSSTTCLEANYFGKVNIFINFDNYSKLYYEEVFLNNSGAYFADTPEEFVALIMKHRNEKVVANPNFYSVNHEEKVKKLIQKHVKGCS